MAPRARPPGSSSRAKRDDRRCRPRRRRPVRLRRDRGRLASTTCRIVDVKIPLGRVLLRHRRVRLGQVHARQRGALQGGGQPPAPGQAAAGRAQARSRGLDQVDKIINIDQSPIGRTPRSNPATYIGLFDHIRDLFSRTQEARARGYKPGRFSLQREGRPLRGLPRRRADQDRDALPARRLRALRAVPRQALQPRDARGALQGQDDRRRARHDRRGGARASSRTSRRSGGACRRCTTSGSTTSGSASRPPRCRAARPSA